MIGTAGWSIARKNAEAFPAEGTALERYARVFDAVEVNSSFYKPHRVSTWEKWAASTPDHFRFAVKVPKAITHQAKLVEVDGLIQSFVQEVGHLGTKLAVLLVQLPPKLGFDASVAEGFFETLHGASKAAIACEPRNASWFGEEADGVLARLQVARVAADPALGPAAAMPGGWRGLAYWRLHGSPVMYRSSYNDETIDAYAAQIQAAISEGIPAWCCFDNTASSAATGDALSLMARLRASG